MRFPRGRSGRSGSSPPRSAVAAALRDATRFDRSAVSPAGGLIAAIPLTAVFGVAVAAGDPVVAATMGAGAMLVGIAWRSGGGQPPVGLLTVDALLMALSTFLGSATGSLPWLHLIVVSAWALAAGLLVALGRRGTVVGTQAVIGIVVFGRFGEPLPGALGLAGLVLAGGLAMVLFGAVVRWPPPLKLQRRAVASAYRALAELARSPAGASTLPAAALLDQAKAALATPSLLGDSAVLDLRSLSDEASRLRIELRAIGVLLEQGIAPDAHAAESRARSLLGLTADALTLMASVIEGDMRGVGQLEAIVAQMSADAAASAEDETAVAAPLARGLAALGGQLRAMARRAPAAGRHNVLFERRPLAGGVSPLAGLRADLARMRANATLESPAGRHAVRLAVVVLITEALSQHIPLERSYWIVVAAATALRPEFAATFTRGAERIIGTCAGVALAGLIVVGLHPSLGVVVPIIGVLGWAAYSVFPASFALGFAFITTLVVFLLDAVTMDTLATAGDRLLDTFIGGAIGLLAYVLWPTWSHKPARQALADVLGAQRTYLALVLSAKIEGREARQDEVSRAARRARLAFTTAQETVTRSLGEPASRRIDSQQSQGILVGLRRLAGTIHVLRANPHNGAERTAMPTFAVLAGEIDQALAEIEARVSSNPDSPGDPVALADLRETYTRLEHEQGPAQGDELLMRELDEIVDAVNSLAALLGGPTGRGASELPDGHVLTLLGDHRGSALDD
jgi:uncharacterized membrane protein YccC